MRKIYYTVIVGFVLTALMWTCLQNAAGIMCGNQIINEQLSPDRKHKFVVFVRTCGATSGFYTHVSILKADKVLGDDDSGNVLTLDDNYRGAFTNKYGGADARVSWITNKKLIIHFDSTAQGRVKERIVRGIEVIYE